MNREIIRLECLKLWHRHDRLPSQVITHAKEYEEYVLGTKDEPKKEVSALVETPKRLKKGVGNSGHPQV